MGAKGLVRGKTVRIVVCAAFALVALLALSAAQATGGKQRGRIGCNWGASSIRAQVVDGRIVSSPAFTSGCLSP
jgi:hypothetical protein